MAYGDAFAAIIGEKYGKRRYHIFSNKSIEGSGAMFLMSVVSVEVSLLFFSTLYSLPLLALTLVALAGGLVATLAEAFSPLGFDNLTVPLFGVVVFLLFSGGI